MRVAMAAAVGVGVIVRVDCELPAVALFVAAEFPQRNRAGPGAEEQADDDVAEAAEVKAGDVAGEAAIQFGDGDEDLQQFDGADQ